MLSAIEQHREQLEALCRRVGARRLDAFGSVVRDDFDAATSDLDFVVEFEPLAPVRYAEAYFSLKQALESLFGRPVDLVTEGSIDNPYLRRRIDAERQTLYAR
jgi:uncharacterized protein